MVVYYTNSPLLWKRSIVTRITVNNLIQGQDRGVNQVIGTPERLTRGAKPERARSIYSANPLIGILINRGIREG